MSFFLRQRISRFREKIISREVVEAQAHESPAKHNSNPLSNIVNVGRAELFEAKFNIDDGFSYNDRDKELLNLRKTFQENLFKKDIRNFSHTIPGVVTKPFTSWICRVGIILLNSRHRS